MFSLSPLSPVTLSYTIGKRRAFIHYNQTQQSWGRSKHKRARAWRLQHPQYVHLPLDSHMVKMELQTLVPLHDVASAHERFSRRLIRFTRPLSPNVRRQLHSTKNIVAHLLLKFFHEGNVARKRERNVPHTSQQRCSALKVETKRALLRSEAEKQSLTGGLDKLKPPALFVEPREDKEALGDDATPPL